MKKLDVRDNESIISVISIIVIIKVTHDYKSSYGQIVDKLSELVSYGYA